jgi:MFS family permease
MTSEQGRRAHTETKARASDGEGSSQFALLRERRFAPFFWTQFLAAFNDNLFKFAFTVMVTFHAAANSAGNPALVVNLIAGLFILPFLLFSATSGQIADKYDKRRIAIFVKTLEVAIMILAGYGFIARNVPVLLACTFLMGLHSTIFGPVKYAFLPQALTERELTGGNAMVEMGTFVAILVGNLVGGVLVGMPESGPQIAAVGCIAVALLGRATVHFMPTAPALVPDLEIKWNPFTETVRNLKFAAENVVVFRGLMGVSWLWFFGASFLTQLPTFAKDVLGGSEGVASLLLVVFSIGIGIGSLLCESLSRRHVELGLVPIGAFGMTAFAVDLYFASRGFVHGPVALTARQFIETPGAFRVLADLGLLSAFAGLFSVPLYALVQSRSAPHAPRPRVRGQQHPRRPVHDRLGRLVGGFDPGRRVHSHDLSGGGDHERGGGPLHLPARARVPAALHLVGDGEPHVPVQDPRRSEHPGARRGASSPATT